MLSFYQINKKLLEENFQRSIDERGGLGSLNDPESRATMFSAFVMKEQEASKKYPGPYTQPGQQSLISNNDGLYSQSEGVQDYYNTTHNAINMTQNPFRQTNMLQPNITDTFNSNNPLGLQPGTPAHILMMRRLNAQQSGQSGGTSSQGSGLKNSIAISSLAYGEIGEYTWKRADYSPPNNLADAIASIAAVCARNKVIGGTCKSKNVSGSNDPLVKAAWNNIRNAVGGVDRTGGGNIMCVEDQICEQVHHAFTYQNGKKVWVPRPRPLTPSGIVEITGSAEGNLKLYFYNMPYKGWLTAKDLQGPH